jgi:hypothetical protein
MDTTLNPAPCYFVIDSIGGLYEGYSDTTCRIIHSPYTRRGWHAGEDNLKLGKAQAEAYIDKWMQDMVEYYTNRAEELQIPMLDVEFTEEACNKGMWYKVHVDLGEVDYEEFESCHTLVVHCGFDDVGPHTVLLYDQQNDMVDWVVNDTQAMRLAAECISLEVNRLKQSLHDEETNPKLYTYRTTSLIFCYDCLADVVRDLERGDSVMVDIDDSCTHYFPVRDMKEIRQR